MRQRWAYSLLMVAFAACSSSRPLRMDADGGMIKFHHRASSQGDRADALAKAQAHCTQNGYSSFSVVHESNDRHDAYLEFKCNHDTATKVAEGSCDAASLPFRGSCSKPYPTTLGFAGNASCIDFYGNDITFDKIKSKCQSDAAETKCPVNDIAMSCGRRKSETNIAVTHFYLSKDPSPKTETYNQMVAKHACPAEEFRCP